MTDPHRLTYDFMPALTSLVIYLIVSGFAVIFLYGVYRRFRLYFGKTIQIDFDQIRKGSWRAIVNAFAQRRVLRKPYPGLMHLLLYSGMIVLLIGTTLVFLDFDIWETFFHHQILVGYFYLVYKMILDAFGVLAIIGILIAICRRTFRRPPNLPTSRDDVFVLLILMIILLTGFLMEGIRLAVDKPTWAAWSFVGYQIALVLERIGYDGHAIIEFYRGLWWFHAILAFTAIASIPYTKLFHLITSPVNAVFAHQRTVGQLSTPFNLAQLVASGNFDIKIGAATIDDFSWRERLAFDSCTSCGRCSDACPATAAGTPLSPMHLILKLRNTMLSTKSAESSPLVSSIVDQEELWACTTCRACVNECPVLIDHIDPIIDMRRHLIQEGKLDHIKRDLLTNLNNSGNPYGITPNDRLKWAEGLDVKTAKEQPEFEVLYWVGCAGSYDPRNQDVSRAIVRILHAANVKFSVLGKEEKCNCEVARRIGEEGRFQQSALELVELFKKYNVKRVLTQCPHCFNTFKNEYPEFGASIEVIHHTQFIADLLSSGRLKLKSGVEKLVTFHDPCYLGRYNRIYDPPRTILSSIGQRKLEMPRQRQNSFCCGGGGANTWYKVSQKKRTNLIRFEEAQHLKPDTLATACPFCTSMFEDAAASSGAKDNISIKDIAELVANSIQA